MLLYAVISDAKLSFEFDLEEQSAHDLTHDSYMSSERDCFTSLLPFKTIESHWKP